MVFLQPQHTDPGLIIAVVAIIMGCFVITTWIRARHGYPLVTPSSAITGMIRARRGSGNGAGDADTDANRKIALLSTENETLIGRIGRLEERIAVMERIVTDPGHATARAIEELR